MRAQQKIRVRCTLMSTLTWQSATCTHEYARTYPKYMHAASLWKTYVYIYIYIYILFWFLNRHQHHRRIGKCAANFCGSAEQLDRRCTVKVRKHICNACAAMPQFKDCLRSKDQLRSKARTQPHLQRALATQNESLSAARIKRCRQWTTVKSTYIAAKSKTKQRSPAAVEENGNKNKVYQRDAA